MTNNSDVKLSVVHEHTDFAIINKPSGVPMHDPEKGIVALMQQQYPSHAWHLVHRLDTGTSGCIILAKHQQAASNLSQLFAKREIEKYYIALSDKKPKKKQGLVKGDMKKARNGNRMLCKSLANPAITQFYSFSARPGLRLFLCKPYTGKTHQIRVALKSQGAPIMGDIRYGGSTATRMHLYSYALRFEYQQQRIEVFYLCDHQTLFSNDDISPTWQRPWQLNWPAI